MTKKEKILLKVIEDTLWMAIRYANGRSTYAPGMIRDVVAELKKVYPKFKLKKDPVLKYDYERCQKTIKNVGLASDWLFDLVE